MITTLEKLKAGETAIVTDILGGRTVRNRLNGLGLHPSDKVRILRNGFFGGPLLIEVHGIEVGIGRGMAEKIQVEIERAP
ncbi:MAG: ferrous iron transport protein A [Deltaproteobacteria bacterium]|nr:ferrous iron transport protein A [Deltaproteobacteria bacterium]